MSLTGTVPQEYSLTVRVPPSNRSSCESKFCVGLSVARGINIIHHEDHGEWTGTARRDGKREARVHLHKNNHNALLVTILVCANENVVSAFVPANKVTATS
jgi:hypothetical protein